MSKNEKLIGDLIEMLDKFDNGDLTYSDLGEWLDYHAVAVIKTLNDLEDAYGELYQDNQDLQQHIEMLEEQGEWL